MNKWLEWCANVALAVCIYIILMFCASQVGLAADTGWYSGAGIGISDYSVGHVDGHIDEYSSLEDLDDGNETVFRLFGGQSDIISVGQHVSFGAELGYANLGDMLSIVEVDAIDLTAVARVHLIGVEFVARVGAAYWDAVTDGTDLTYALGLEKNFSSAFARVEWQRYDDVENTIDIDTFMLSGGMNF